MRVGLTIVAVTFCAVALVLCGQVFAALVRPVPGLYYALALCDLPTTAGAWLAALAARDLSRGLAKPPPHSVGPHPDDGSAFVAKPLLLAALGFSVVFTVVWGELAGKKLGLTGLAALLGSRPAWALADVATLIGMGAILSGAARLASSHARARELPTGLVAAALALLGLRAVSALWGALGAVPWPLRLGEAALYLAVAACLLLATRGAARAGLR